MPRKLGGLVALLFSLWWTVAVLGRWSWAAPFVFVLYAALWRRIRSRRALPSMPGDRRNI